jgi:phenylacetate-coenzyme A ligase PaaK-like adenylate-forming protein
VAAALEDDLGLDGVTFVVQGEPFTEARRRLVEAAGARALVRYGSMEVPTAGLSCATPVAADDVHLFSDRYVLTRRARTVGDAAVSVDALLFTSLSTFSPKVLLNAETGDCAVVEQRACGCGLGALGLTTHLREIRSFEKLTGEGMTFAASSLVQVVEDCLPARFGGTGLDYQLVEEERACGATRLTLRVNPAVGPLDEEAVRATVLEELGRNDPVERYMAELWQRAGTVEVVRKPPMATRAGKILPFHLAKAGRVETAERMI